MTNFNEWSKIGLAFAVGVSLSAGYVALGMQSSPAPTVVIEERCSERATPAPAPVELTGTPLDWGVSKAELDAMADHCEVRDDRPQPLDDALAAKLGLSDDEREAYERALAGFGGQGIAHRFTFLHDLDPSIDIKELSDEEQVAKIDALAAKTKTDDDRSLFRHMAEERAGERKLPTERHLARSSIWAQWQRYQYAHGDRFAELLARDLDVARVNELRGKHGGWPGGVVTRRGCEDVPLPVAEPAEFSAGDEPYKQIVARVVRAHLDSIRACYEDGLKADAALAGKIAVEFTIGGSDGKVRDAAIADGTSIDDAKMQACVVESVAGWVFPKPREGGDIHITYPFKFSPNP